MDMLKQNTSEPAFCHQPFRVRFAQFELDSAGGTLRCDGREVPLPPQQFTILITLVSQAGVLVTREQLRQALWGDDAFVDFDAGLNFCIRQLRRALGDEAGQPRFIQTVPRRGYRFVAQVSPVEAGRGLQDQAALRDRAALRDQAALRVWPHLRVAVAVAAVAIAAFSFGMAAAGRDDNPDARIADAHSAHGFVALNDKWEWAEAERALDRALYLDPTHEVALISMSRLHAAHGRFALAISYAQRAVAAHPESMRGVVTLGWTQLFAGDAPAAAATCGAAVGRQPGSGHARLCVVFARLARGSDESATLQRVLANLDNERRPHSAFLKATLLAALGQDAAALESLQAAFTVRDPDATFALVHPAFARLRHTSQFKSAAVLAGLPADPSEISSFSH